MRILVFHQYYRVKGEAGGSRFNELARFWTEAGHEVAVVAGSINYATGEIPAALRGRWVSRAEEDGITVYRCYVPRTYNRSYAGRAYAFAVFTASSLWAGLRAQRPDVVIATSPPLLVALSGIATAWRHRAPLVFEVRDLWPESAVATGVLGARSLVTRALYALERWSYRLADKINVLTPAFKDDIVARGLAPEEKICLVPNGADVDQFRPGARDSEARRRHGWGDRFVALYAGAHGRANALGQLLDAAERLRAREDVLVVTVGDGPERIGLAREAARRGLTNIQFLGAQPKESMPDYVNGCDVGLAVLKRCDTFRTVYPNKVFDYMSCARPSIVAIDGVARRMVCDDAQAGLFAEPEDGGAIARAIVELADDGALRRRMGESGRRWVLENASRDRLARRYLEVLQELARGRRGTPAAEPEREAVRS